MYKLYVQAGLRICCAQTPKMGFLASRRNVTLHHQRWPHLLSSQPRVTVMSFFVYKVITDLESIDHTSDLSIRISSSGAYKSMFYLSIM